MATASATAEPRTLEEMHARYRATQERNAAAARRLEEQRRAREAADRAAVKARTANPAPTPRERFQARQKEALDARVFTVLDPDKLAREPKRIIARVAAEHGFTIGDILGPRRSKPLIRARHLAMAEVSERRRDLSLLTLGRIFNRDHTTILHALRRLGLRDGSPAEAAPAASPREPEAIIQSVAEKHGLQVAAIMGARHTARVIVARDDAIAAVTAEHPGLSTGDLVAIFKRDPSTIRKAQRQHGLRPAVSSPTPALSGEGRR